jgi:hypothetical protein
MAMREARTVNESAAFSRTFFHPVSLRGQRGRNGDCGLF